MFKNSFYILLLAIISWGSYQISYPTNTTPNLYYEGVFFENIIKHIKQITAGSRGVGDDYHDDVERYLKRELNQMGLSVSVQTSLGFNDKNRTAAPVRNIIATYPGTQPNSQALLLMAHYDAAKFSATGAGDDASGVAIILESINAMLQTAQAPSNNLVILFTDAEEIGLLGAHAFINEQLSYYNIGLIVNLEARGTSGPAMMWPETVGGNQAMIEHFKAANIPMPVTSSLHYEIYRMLPNDTDLTPFNQQAKLNGYNFAFIDDHFNYHTQKDSLENLSLNTLAHETIQFYSLLKHLAQTDLSQMQTASSLVYFSLPLVGLISHSTTVTWLVLTVSVLVLIGLMIIAFSRKQLVLKSLLAGFAPILTAIAVTYVWCWLLVKALYALYPEFHDILQGFPYSGHLIMGAFLLSGGIASTSILAWFSGKNPLAQSFANILLWLIITIPACYALPGSGLLVWPVLFSVLLLLIQVFTQKLADTFAAVFAVAAFILLGWLLVNFPIALGIQAIPLTAVIMAALLALFSPLFRGKPTAVLTLAAMLTPLALLAWHFIQKPTISQQQPLPTSLSYLYDLDEKKGYFFNYDTVATDWNQQLFAHSENDSVINEFRSHYKKPLKNLASVAQPVALEGIDIQAEKLLGPLDQQEIEVTFTAHSKTEILEIYSKVPIIIHHMSIDKRNAVFESPLQLETGNRLLHYYFDGKKQIKLRLTLPPGQTIDWQLQSHSTDLLDHPAFKLQSRPDTQMPKPFIKSDNTITVQSFTFGSD
ncbi:MAG: M20/M25/M40 family metallo-hydrolase [Marinicella sp.]